jgi:threonine/homoserine/homoserine lactone efflux protein
MLLSYLLSAAAIGFSAGVTPGPLQAVFLSYAIKGGWKKALPAAFAPLVTDGPVILLVLVILNNLPEVFLRICKLAGRSSFCTWPGNRFRRTASFGHRSRSRTRAPGAPC